LQPEIVIQYTQNWVREVVIGLNFCPFASKVVSQKQVRYVVEDSTYLEAALELFLLECNRLDTDEDIETTLVIYPNSFQLFDDYLHFLDLAEQLLFQQGYDGIYQVASFHPNYQFEGADETDPANFTNRSPYPMLHILREESIEEALEKYPHTDQIPERNVEFAREKGLEYMKRLRDACLRV
jgi:hypothetical protein